MKLNQMLLFIALTHALDLSLLEFEITLTICTKHRAYVFSYIYFNYYEKTTIIYYWEIYIHIIWIVNLRIEIIY